MVLRSFPFHALSEAASMFPLFQLKKKFNGSEEPLPLALFIILEQSLSTGCSEVATEQIRSVRWDFSGQTVNKSVSV